MIKRISAGFVNLVNMNKLFKHQKDFLKEDHNKKLLVWETGTGKTLTSIEWAKEKSDRILVICPKALKENWAREIDKWSDIPARFAIVTKEEFRRDWDKASSFNCIIVDEMHYFSGMKSAMSKSLEKYTKKHEPEFILGLTATPFMSNPWSIYRLSNLLGYNLNWRAFRDEFFYEVRMGRRLIPVMKNKKEKDVALLVKRMGSVVKLNDCVDVPESVHELETFKLTTKQEKAIKEVVDILPIVRYTKHHQICGGSLKGDDYTESQRFKCDKLDRVLELIQENNKAIVVSRYNEEGAMICDFIRENSKSKVFIINGSIKNRDEVIQEFNSTDNSVLVCQAACSEGWEAPTCDTMIFYSYDYSLKNYIQMCGRIQRINNIHKCKYISLVVPKTIDEEVYKSIQRKEDFHVELYK